MPESSHPRAIVHLDADAFFASVEQSADSRLRGKPIAVGGEKRGIIASASYEARQFGIYTPMPTVVARRLCPKLILLPGDFEKYELFSRLMFSYAYDFTPEVEIGSIDEGYFDLTGVRRPAVNIAEKIKDAIQQALRLSVSEGIGSNKLISQIASKRRKPAAFEFVEPGNESGFLASLPNKWLPGVGPKTANQLNAAGLALIGQIAQTPPALLGLLVGSMAPQLRNFALGLDDRPIVPVRASAKSYGEQETFAADTTDEPFLEATLRRMADKLMVKVREDDKTVRTLTVKVRYNDMDEEQASESLGQPTDLETEIYSKVSRLLRKAWKRRVSLRLVSLKLSNLYDGRFRGELALDVSARQHDAQQRLADTVDQLRQKFGRRILFRGHDFILRAKDGHGEEPSDQSSLKPRVFVPPLINTPLQRGVSSSANVSNRFSGFPKKSHTTPIQLNESPTPYNLAVVQRQRLGHYAARHPPEASGTERGCPSRSSHDSSEACKPTQLHSVLQFAAAGAAALRGCTEKMRPQPPEAKVRRISIGPELRFRSTSPPTQPSIPRCAEILPRRIDTRHICVPLNIHSYYSFLDSTLSINAIIDLAKRHQLPAIALTDKNNLHGAVEFAQAAAQAGIKPLIGAELEFNGHRACLYVQNKQGYHNLCRILNAEGRGAGVEGRERNTLNDTLKGGHRTGPVVRCPPFRVSDLVPHPSDCAVTLNSLPTDGLLALSPSAELAHFFPDRFYLEINSLEALEKHSLAPSPTSPLSPSSLPAVASFPVHYALPADRWKYNIVQSIRTLTLLRQQHSGKRLDGEFHFQSSVEMQKLFGARPDLLANSLEIAERCSFEFSLGTPQFPGYKPPEGYTPASFLRHLVMEGLQRRYPKKHAGHKSQLEEELAIITEVGYEEYFLVMWDILQECRRRGIEWITRGSAADSLACYCLEISGVCPIRFNLYFRRFLNQDRMALNKLPDIDVDFPHDRKDDVIDLIFEKFGAANTAIVGGFSTFQSRSAFAEVAKVLGVSEFQVRRITERLPNFSRASELNEAVAGSQECRDLPLEEEPYRSALQMAHFLDGFPRYPKMHPCGLVLSRQPMDEIVPCFTSAKGYPTTHFDMDSIESIGLVKMDILAQGGLAVMRDVKEMLEIGARSQEPEVMAGGGGSSFKVGSSMFDVRCSVPPALDLAALEPWDDSRVWELISSGHARAVHHIESPAMISLSKMCNVRDIDTLIAIVSVIRPGAANESKKMEFARRYQRLSPTYYPHPSLEECLRNTYGLVVYEEHILQICEAFAGLPPGRADVLRRALGKDREDVIAEIKIEFADCARKRGRTEDKIAEVWDLVVSFKGYAFCKAHSTAYGIEAYQSAWLKLNYPAEFMAAVLTNGKGFYDPLVYVLECHRLGISLLPPSVNEPGPQFTVINSKPEGRNQKQIRVPVTNIKGLTHRTKETILSESARTKFSSLHDFILRVHPLQEDMEVLIQAGAFDVFGKPRTTQYWEFKSLAQNLAGVRSTAPPSSSKNNRARWNGNGVTRWNASLPASPTQLQLLPPENLERLPSVPLAEPNRLQCLRWEEQLLGYAVTGHPLDLYPDIAWDTYCPINRLNEHIGEQIITCGLVIEQRLFHQITGEPMKFITIADWTGVIETELFARTYKSYGLNTIRYRVLEIAATVEPFENGRGYTLRVLRAGKPREKKKQFNSVGDQPGQ